LKATFSGLEGFMGLNSGKLYDINVVNAKTLIGIQGNYNIILRVESHSLSRPVICTYETLEEFLSNWNLYPLLS